MTTNLAAQNEIILLLGQNKMEHWPEYHETNQAHQLINAAPTKTTSMDAATDRTENTINKIKCGL